MQKQNKTSKNKKIISTLIAVLILVSIICALSVAYNFLGGFYYCRVISFQSALGQDQTIQVSGSGAFSCAANFSGSLVVESGVRQNVYVQSKTLNNPLYLRASMSVNGFTSAGQMFGFTNWVMADDGYLYFNQPLKSNQKIGLCNTVELNLQSKLRSDSNYIIILTIEASEAAWDTLAQPV